MRVDPDELVDPWSKLVIASYWSCLLFPYRFPSNHANVTFAKARNLHCSTVFIVCVDAVERQQFTAVRVFQTARLRKVFLSLRFLSIAVHCGLWIRLRNFPIM